MGFDKLFRRDNWIGTAGPYGGVSILNAALDAKTILDPKYYQYLASMEGFVKSLMALATPKRRALLPTWESHVAWLRDISEGCSSFPVKPERPDRFISRLVFISEGGGKTRGVTPVNYHVQGVLRPFHDCVMELLRRIPMDCSFDEAKGVKALIGWTSDRVSEPSGFDASDYTDVLSRDIQSRVVKHFFGSDVAKFWKALMAIPVYMGKEHGERSFSVGAPMGIYGLWPVAALTHHVVCQISALRAGLRRSGELYRLYFLRGDDVLSKEKAFMEHHRSIMQDELGIKVSEQKTIGYRHGVQCAEFAKRTAQHGRVISGIPVKQISASRRLEPLLSLELVEHLLGMVRVEKLQRSPHFTPPLVCTLLHGRYIGCIDSLRPHRTLPRVNPITGAVSLGMGHVAPTKYSRKLLNVLQLPFCRERVRGWKDLRGMVMPPKLPFMTEKSFEYWIELDIYPRLAERLVRRAQSMLGLRSYNELLDSLSDVIGKDIHARIVKDDVPLLRTHPQESESGEETLVVHPDHPLNGVFRRVGEELRDNAPTCLGVGQSAVKFSKALRCLREMEGMTEAVRKSGRYITRLRELSRYHKDILKWTELILIGINPQS